MMMDASTCLRRLIEYIEANDYAGYDPYDALNSPLIGPLGRRIKWFGIGCTQFIKRCPVNIRPLLLIPRQHNPKAIGLFLWGYAKLHKSQGQERWLERCNYLLGLLERLKSPGYSGNCWGYNFDWQARAFFVPRFTPTVVNSSFIGHALLDLHAYTGNAAALDMAVPIADFILKDLHRSPDGDTFCFSYTPLDHSIVHNASILGASLLIRLHGITGNEKLKEAALAALEYSLKRQDERGAWVYGEAPHHQWIDSFHTGFNLQGLLYFVRAGFEQYRIALDRGTDFYEKHFFLADGTPTYYHDRVYPIDIHSPAQAMVFFSQMGPAYAPLTDRIIRWMLNNMLSPKGYFYFQKRKRRTHRIPYMRWSQAWAFHGLTSCALARSAAPVQPAESTH